MLQPDSGSNTTLHGSFHPGGTSDLTATSTLRNPVDIVETAKLVPVIPKIVIKPPSPSHTPDLLVLPQVVKDKLCEKLKGKMSQPPPQPPERDLDRIVPISKPPSQPLFPRPAPQITQIRSIKQHNTGPGRKIYLTMRSQAGAASSSTSSSQKVSYVLPSPRKSIEVLHDFPQSSVKSERV